MPDVESRAAYSPEKKKEIRDSAACLLSVVGLLVLILVPLSFSYVDYFEYGLKQRKSTNKIDLSKVYDSGRYLIGPDFTFLKYQADSHHVKLRQLGVFSAGESNSSIGLEFQINIDFTFLLNKNDIATLHQQLASSYLSVVTSRAKDAVKNEAIFVSFQEYFQSRKAIESRFRLAVQKRWDEAPPLQVTLDQFHVGRIQIPESVARKQLESKLQNERNDKESYLQQAQIERDMTAVEVNAVLLEKDLVLKTAEAYASLVTAKGKAEAKKTVEDAQNLGFRHLFNAANITTQAHKASFDYIRTLTNKADVELGMSFMSDNNVLKTRTA